MLGLLIGIVLVPTMVIILLRAGRTIREMLAYSTNLPTNRSKMLPISTIKPVYGADA